MGHDSEDGLCDAVVCCQHGGRVWGWAAGLLGRLYPTSHQCCDKVDCACETVWVCCDGAGDAVYACAPIVVWGRPCDSCSRAYLLPCHGLVCHSQRPVVVVEGRDSAPHGSGCRLCLSFPHRLVPLILIELIKTIP